MRKIFFHFLTSLGLTLFFVQCNKPSENPDPTTVNFSILSLSPQHGNYQTVAVISGSGFDTNAANDSVFFNGKPAVVTSASNSQLYVQVPGLCGTGSVVVKINGVATTGPVFNYDTTWVVSTLAGNNTPGSADGIGMAASFNKPTALVADSAGNIFVCDNYNNTIRKITPQGVVSTFAGQAGQGGSTDGPGAVAKFSGPLGMCIDKHGNLFVADMFSQKIRKITPTGIVSTIAGINGYGSLDGPIATATFSNPSGVTVDDNGTVYVSDRNTMKIRKISNGYVSTIAGTGTAGQQNGPAATATFWDPIGLAVSPDGSTLYIGDGAGFTIRKLSNGIVSTYAGSSAPGNADGVGTNAHFTQLNHLYLDAQGTLFVADIDNHKIRKVDPSATVTSFVGGGIGDVDGPVPMASFRQPYAITFDKAGNGYISDWTSNRIRKLEIK